MPPLGSVSADATTTSLGEGRRQRIERVSYCCLLLGRLGETKPPSKGHSKEKCTSICRVTTCAVPYGDSSCFYHVASVLFHGLVAPVTVFQSDGTPETPLPILRALAPCDEAHNKLTIRDPNIASVEAIS